MELEMDLGNQVVNQKLSGFALKSNPPENTKQGRQEQI